MIKHYQKLAAHLLMLFRHKQSPNVSGMGLCLTAAGMLNPVGTSRCDSSWMVRPFAALTGSSRVASNCMGSLLLLGCGFTLSKLLAVFTGGP